jgi:hypothetical protein
MRSEASWVCWGPSPPCPSSPRAYNTATKNATNPDQKPIKSNRKHREKGGMEPAGSNCTWSPRRRPSTWPSYRNLETQIQPRTKRSVTTHTTTNNNKKFATIRSRFRIQGTLGSDRDEGFRVVRARAPCAVAWVRCVLRGWKGVGQEDVGRPLKARRRSGNRLRGI